MVSSQTQHSPTGQLLVLKPALVLLIQPLRYLDLKPWATALSQGLTTPTVVSQVNCLPSLYLHHGWGWACLLLLLLTLPQPPAPDILEWLPSRLRELKLVIT